MKKYNFRLQRVLDIKNVMQKLRERELAKALTALEIEELTLKEQKENRLSYQTEVRERKIITVFEMRIYSLYFAFLQGEIESQFIRIVNCKNEVRSRKKNLTEAYRDKRVIENLKQKSRQQYMREYDREEQIDNDEVSLSSFFKKSNVSM